MVRLVTSLDVPAVCMATVCATARCADRGNRAAARALIVLRIRRYLCQGCHAVVTVLPREAAPRRHYSVPAIAWALALFGLTGLAYAEVRARTSPLAGGGRRRR